MGAAYEMLSTYRRGNSFISFMGIIQCCLCKEHYPDKLNSHTFEPPHEKTNNMHIQNQRRRSAQNAKLISAFVFATRRLQFLYFLNPKFSVSIQLLCLYSPVCVGPVRKQQYWFSHAAAHLFTFLAHLSRQAHKVSL